MAATLLLAALSPGPRPAGAAIDPAVGAADCANAALAFADDSKVTCIFGLTGDQLKELTDAAAAGATEAMRDRLEALSRRLGVSKEAARILLRIAGEQPGAPDQDLGKTLTRLAAEYKILQARMAAMRTESPLARALVTQAKTEIAAGRFSRGSDLLQEMTRRVETVAGSCSKIEAMGIALDPAICAGQLLNSEYRDDHIAFTFVSQSNEGGAVLSFSGFGPAQLHLDRDNVVLPIDTIVSTLQGSGETLEAQGSCLFSNPYRGKPSSVSCEAATSAGKFIGKFASDGAAPNVVASEAAHSALAGEPLVLQGQCAPSSHVAEGRIGEDLGKRQARFFCDSAVIIAFRDDPRHRLIHFDDSQSSRGRALGFGGYLEDSEMLAVRSVALESGRASASADGGCKLFFERQAISAIVCGARIDEAGKRTVPVVTFAIDKAGEVKSGR